MYLAMENKNLKSGLKIDCNLVKELTLVVICTNVTMIAIKNLSSEHILNTEIIIKKERIENNLMLCLNHWF